MKKEKRREDEEGRKSSSIFPKIHSMKITFKMLIGVIT
jgi:hypothetical protein